MVQWLIGCGVASVVFVGLDFLWLSTVGQSVYRPALKDLFADRVHLAPAVAFYLVYVIGVMLLAVQPGVRAQSALTAATMAAVLGFVAYATYDLTNMATLKVWPLKIAVLDIAWGTLLTALAAGLACYAMLRLGSQG